MEYSYGDPGRARRHDHCGHEDDDEERESGRQPLPRRRDEQRYPSNDDRHHSGHSDPSYGGGERYPIGETGGVGSYGNEIHRKPTSQGGYASVQHVAHQVFDEGTGGYPVGGSGGSYGEDYRRRPTLQGEYGSGLNVARPVLGEETGRYEEDKRYPIGGGGGSYGEEDRRRPTSQGGYVSVQHVAHQVFGEGSGGYPVGGSGGGGSYGQEALRRPTSQGGYGYSEHVAPHVFDERPSYATSGYVQHVDAGYGGRIASSDQVGEGGRLDSGKKTVRVFTKAAEGYSLTVRDGEVVLARADSRDEYQHWIKDDKYCTKVKDEEGLPSFALVNKATGQAIKHSIGATEPVRLVPYDPDRLDTSVLWTESGDTGGNFHCIRMVTNITLNFDAFHGDKDHGGVRDGTKVVLWEWLQGENQQWKIVPY